MANTSGGKWKLSYSCPLGDDFQEIPGEHDDEGAARSAAQAWIDEQISLLTGPYASREAELLRMSVFITRPEGGTHRFRSEQVSEQTATVK